MTILCMNGDKYLSFVILFQMIAVTIQSLLPLSGLISVEGAATMRIVVTLLTYIPGIYIVFLRKPRLLVFSMLFYFLFLFFNYLLFPASHTFIESSYAFTLTPISVLTALMIICIDDFLVFTRVLLSISRWSVFIAVVYVIAYSISPFKEMDDTYSMSFGYSMLLPAMYLFTQSGIKDKLCSFILFVLILFCASRGSLVVLGVFYLIDIFLFESPRTKISVILLVFVLSVIGISFLPHYIDIESSRTFSLFESGELLSHDSGREDKLYSILNPIIMESPIWGWGVGADRQCLDGVYSHNVFYELFVHYGIVGGGVLLMVFFVWCSRLFFSEQIRCEIGNRQMFIMMFLYGFVPLLVSGSYLIEIFFAIMIGYFVRVSSDLEYDVYLKYDELE